MIMQPNPVKRGSGALGLTLPALLLAGPFTLAATANPPEFIDLLGVVRDFHESSHANGHPDMEPANPEMGLFAGNVSLQISSDNKPVFAGPGYYISQQPTTNTGKPIAFHLTNMKYECDMDYMCVTFYDNEVPWYEICLDKVTFKDDGTSWWTYHVVDLPGGRDLSHWKLALDPAAHPQVLPGTTQGYDLGTGGPPQQGNFYGIKWDVPNNFQHGYFTIVLQGHFMGASNDASVVAKGGPQSYFEKIMAPSTEFSATGSPYPWSANLVPYDEANDTAGMAAGQGSGNITSSEAFDQWFRDVPGVNMSMPLLIRLQRQSDGNYYFNGSLDPNYADLGGFFPIDGELFGNSNGSSDHNYHFTFELHTQFTYDASANQFFRVSGGDDVWVFIDNKLAIDLGGIHSGLNQYADLDRLCLVDGETYSLSFFFAQRAVPDSHVEIETNIELEGVQIPSVTAMFD